MALEFTGFPKIARLSRECTITEKLDGTNAQIHIRPAPPADPWETPFEYGVDTRIEIAETLYYIRAGSKTQWIVPNNVRKNGDNHGFAAWVHDNAQELAQLGPGQHFGEWWGFRINRGYGLSEKRFSLFNISRWSSPDLYPKCCYVVPILWRGEMDTVMVNNTLTELRIEGSRAAPGFMNPEGIVVYHSHANIMLKKTIKGDEEGKHAEAHPKKERVPQQPRVKDPSKGGRRKKELPFAGFDRRKK